MQTLINEKTTLLKHLGTTLMRVDNINLDKLEVEKEKTWIRINYDRFEFILELNEKGEHSYTEIIFSDNYHSDWDKDIDFMRSQTKMFLAFQENLKKIENILIEYLKK